MFLVVSFDTGDNLIHIYYIFYLLVMSEYFDIFLIIIYVKLTLFSRGCNS